MTAHGRDWNEKSLTEDPAVDVLVKLGYRCSTPDDLQGERESLKDVVLVPRLTAALRKLNPWLSGDTLQKAVRAVTSVQAEGLIEANRDLHTTITLGKSFEQDRGKGKKSQDVRYIDFGDPFANDLLVARQYLVKGGRKTIRPDFVVFVNGIPLAVIECKSPTVGNGWRGEAVHQILRYQDKGQGADRLFYTVQIVVATCYLDAVYGTVGTPPRFFAQWKDPYPRTLRNLRRDLHREPTAQDILLYGLFAPENLLDAVRTFVVFEKEQTSHKLVKKLCRYQQFRAVNAAMNRVRTAKTPSARGGVVWHTQGSGKSLTMLWLALKLRRDPLHENPTIVIVADRVDLDDQITGTFERCGFPNPVAAANAADLRALLCGPPGVTVTTTVQKFRELMADMEGERGEGAVLNPAPNVFVFIDEAHRTQYGVFAANMRAALPNACFFGFSGTPIDRKDRSTLRTFGPYIDTYTIRQAVADGATVPIFYESRLPKLRIVGASIDRVFERVFADRSKAEREAIKQKYATEESIAGAPRRIEAICLDLVDHYTSFIRPGGFKAQVVAVSREAAVTYAEKLKELHGPPSEVVISSAKDDPPSLAEHGMTDDERRKLIDRFLDPKDPLAILVVCDMLLTGFDAPIEQVMYLDKPLREHTLLQAIARVNRTAEGKDYGLVVDYWGVSGRLQEALDIFSPEDVKGAMTPKSDELPRLQGRHAAAMRLFLRVQDKDDLEACLAVLAPEDVRMELDVAFRRFTRSLDMLLPDPRALSYVDDLRWLAKVRKAAAARFRDERLDISDCGAKVKRLIEESVAVEGMDILVQRVSLFSKDFDEKLAALKSDDAKASEMEHAILDEIHVKLDENPAYYTSLHKRLTQIIEDRKAQRIDEAKQLALLDTLVKEARGQGQAAEQLGLSPTAYAIYGVLREAKPATAAAPDGPTYDPTSKELASLIEETVEGCTHIVDWVQKDDVQREMRRQIKRKLGEAGVTGTKADDLAKNIVELAKARMGR
jgi:type I restriction enzyme, R subunit